MVVVVALPKSQMTLTAIDPVDSAPAAPRRHQVKRDELQAVVAGGGGGGPPEGTGEADTLRQCPCRPPPPPGETKKTNKHLQVCPAALPCSHMAGLLQCEPHGLGQENHPRCQVGR